MSRMHRLLALIILSSLPVLILAAPQQPPQATDGQRAPSATAVDEGIPVTDPEVVKACGACHVPDARQRMTRISYRRATPENWELTIRRMMSLNGVQISPEVARRVIKSLSDSHGLAPEEARTVMFEAERRLIDFTYEGDKETHTLCSTCHSIGRVLSERRTKEEWAGLLAMHRYYYPGIDGGSGGFRRGAGGGAGGANGRGAGADAAGRGRGADNQQPMDRAHDHLAKAFPPLSPDWATWSAA